MNDIKQVIAECIQEELTRKEVRRIVAEEVYRRAKAGDPKVTKLIKEWAAEGQNSEMAAGNGENRRRQVQSFLQDPTTNVSAVMRKVVKAEGEEGEWSDDALRSYGSKLGRGELPISDEKATDIYSVMRSKK